MDKLKLPTKEECIELLKKNCATDNVIEHSIMVSKIAKHLAEKLVKKGIKVNVELVEKAALLHDIGKIKCIKNNNERGHGKKAEEILKNAGYPELGKLAKMHMLSRVDELKTWEEKVVFYADKRISRRKVVSLKKRYEDMEKRYKIPEHKKTPFEKLLKLEREIFDFLMETPEIIEMLIL